MRLPFMAFISQLYIYSVLHIIYCGDIIVWQSYFAAMATPSVFSSASASALSAMREAR